MSEQLVLSFDFWEEEIREAKAKRKAELDSIPWKANPIGDKELYRTLQYKAENGDKAAQDRIFFLVRDTAVKLIKREIEDRKIPADRMQIDDWTSTATILFMEQRKKNGLLIHDSYVAYLYLMVMRAMFHQTKAQKLEAWCKKKKIDFFNLEEDEKENIRFMFEKDRKKEPEEDEDYNFLEELNESR